MYIQENSNLTINKEKIEEIKAELNNSTIVAATKYVSENCIKELLEVGINNLGENRTDAFLRKYEELKGLDIKWHFIGHLQRNKAKDIINKIDYLHSLDSLELAKIINKERKEPLKCFIEVKLSNSDSKNGVLESELENFINSLKEFNNIDVIGLMAMTEKEMSSNDKYLLFKSLYDLGIKYNLSNFSMGMSEDYKEALRAGATHIRLGRILFK